MKSSVDTYTVGQLAKFCEVTRATIINWARQERFETVKLPSGHIRIKKNAIISFLKQYNMPIPKELGLFVKKVNILSGDLELVDFIRRQLALVPKLECEIAMTADPVDAMLNLGVEKPDIFVLDARMTNFLVKDVARRVSEMGELENSCLVIFTGFVKDNKVESYGGFGDALPKPWLPEQFYKKVQEVIHV